MSSSLLWIMSVLRAPCITLSLTVNLWPRLGVTLKGDDHGPCFHVAKSLRLGGLSCTTALVHERNRRFRFLREETAMRRHLRACLVGSAVAVVLLMVATSTLALAGQPVNQARGLVQDEYGNPIKGATVAADLGDDRAPLSATSGDNGDFLFTLQDSPTFTFTERVAGYQGARIRAAGLLGIPRPMVFELPALPMGLPLPSRTAFVSDPAGTIITFEDDGTFSFEDVDGEGTGTYGRQELTAALVVREYDGPNNKFSISEPLTAEFADQNFTSFMLGDQKLVKQ